MKKRNDLNDDDEVRDRETIRVPMYLTDHRPGYRYATDDMAALRASVARDEMIKQIGDAWRGATPQTEDADSDPVRGRTAAYDAYVTRLTSAWRTPIRDAPEPDLGSRPEELRRPRSESDPADPSAAKTREREVETWLGRDPAELARDLESKRDAIHAERNASLANAWKTPTSGHHHEGTGGGVAPGREWLLEHY